MKPDEVAFLRAVAALPPWGFPRDIVVGGGIAPKRAFYLLEKWSRKGWYSYGVTLDLGWLEPAGRARAEELRDADSD